MGGSNGGPLALLAFSRLVCSQALYKYPAVDIRLQTNSATAWALTVPVPSL